MNFSDRTLKTFSSVVFALSLLVLGACGSESENGFGPNESDAKPSATNVTQTFDYSDFFERDIFTITWESEIIGESNFVIEQCADDDSCTPLYRIECPKEGSCKIFEYPSPYMAGDRAFLRESNYSFSRRAQDDNGQKRATYLLGDSLKARSQQPAFVRIQQEARGEYSDWGWSD